MKSGSRTWWWVVIAMFAAFSLYLASTGRCGEPRNLEPEEEFPAPQKPPSG